MLMPHITQKYKDNLDAAHNANHSLAVFVKVGTPRRRLRCGVLIQKRPLTCPICPLSAQRCFTFMDRGFVFKQINNYMNCFVPGDPKVQSLGCFLFFFQCYYTGC